jgi:hypothetical protein
MSWYCQTPQSPLLRLVSHENPQFSFLALLWRTYHRYGQVTQVILINNSNQTSKRGWLRNQIPRECKGPVIIYSCNITCLSAMQLSTPSRGRGDYCERLPRHLTMQSEVSFHCPFTVHRHDRSPAVSPSLQTWTV